MSEIEGMAATQVSMIPVDLRGQVALITGATSRLGARFATIVAQAGAKVALAGRGEAALAELTSEIRACEGCAQPYVLDLMNLETLTEVYSKIEENLGTVTILVNNAGVLHARQAHKMSLEAIDQTLSVNVKAPFILSCEFARRLIEAKLPGRIVNIASVMAFDYGEPGGALYSISKAAVVRMTETLAIEWARNNINVNAIAPGAFLSDMTQSHIERAGNFFERFPRKRLGDPVNLDSTLLYLLSPQSDFVTGACIKVDDAQFHR